MGAKKRTNKDNCALVYCTIILAYLIPILVVGKILQCYHKEGISDQLEDIEKVKQSQHRFIVGNHV